MWFDTMDPVTRLALRLSAALDRFAASPLTCWWANYGLSLCAADDTVEASAETVSRCPVLRAVASLKAEG
jgi:hypothetical protein